MLGGGQPDKDGVDLEHQFYVVAALRQPLPRGKQKGPSSQGLLIQGDVGVFNLKHRPLRKCKSVNHFTYTCD